MIYFLNLGLFLKDQEEFLYMNFDVFLKNFYNFLLHEKPKKLQIDLSVDQGF